MDEIGKAVASGVTIGRRLIIGKISETFTQRSNEYRELLVKYGSKSDITRECQAQCEELYSLLEELGETMHY